MGALIPTENYDVDFNGVTTLELRIVPNSSGSGARAQLRLA
jgi:hypothetical protein